MVIIEHKTQKYTISAGDMSFWFNKYILVLLALCIYPIPYVVWIVVIVVCQTIPVHPKDWHRSGLGLDKYNTNPHAFVFKGSLGIVQAR